MTNDKTTKIKFNRFTKNKLKEMIKKHGCYTREELLSYIKKYEEMDYDDEMVVYLLYDMNFENTFKDVMNVVESNFEKVLYRASYLGRFPAMGTWDDETCDKLGKILVEEGYFCTVDCPQYLLEYLDYEKIVEKLLEDEIKWLEDPDHDWSGEQSEVELFYVSEQEKRYEYYMQCQ